MGYNPSESDMKAMMEDVDKKRIRFKQFEKIMLKAIQVGRRRVAWA
jgi:Ca2+-binding EF-hand superfamily protein